MASKSGGPAAKPAKRAHREIAALRQGGERFFEAWLRCPRGAEKSGPQRYKPPRARRPCFAWCPLGAPSAQLSLVGLLLSRAQLRFARQHEAYYAETQAISKPAKRAHRLPTLVNPAKSL